MIQHFHLHLGTYQTTNQRLAEPPSGSTTATPSETSRSEAPKSQRSNPNAGKYYQEYLRRDAPQKAQQQQSNAESRDPTAHETDHKDSIQRAALAKSQPQNQNKRQNSYQPQAQPQNANGNPLTPYPSQPQYTQPSASTSTRRPSAAQAGPGPDAPLPYRPAYNPNGSPKVFPGELKPITGAYGGYASGAHEKIGAERMPGGGTGLGGDKEAKARRLAERATAGEESFRDF